MSRSLTINAGQLAASATTLLSGVALPKTGRRLDLVFQNTGTSAQTIVLTFQRIGGTSRRLMRAELEPDEQLLVTSIPIEPDDVLLGATTDASLVDYLVFAAAGGPMRIEVLSANGTNKGVAALRSILLGMEQLIDTTLPDPG